MRSVFYYGDSCRENFMGGSFRTGIKFYLHPDKAFKLISGDGYDRAYSKDYYIKLREFSLQLWRRFFSKLEGWNSVLKEDEEGVYYDTPQACYAAHFFMGIVKSMDLVSKKPVEEWNVKDFVAALTVGHQHNDGEDKATMARFCVILSCACSDWYSPTTDNIEIKKDAKILVPEEIKPLLTKADFRWFKDCNIKPEDLESVPPIFDEFLDSRIRFQRVTGGTFTIKDGLLVQEKEPILVTKE